MAWTGAVVWTKLARFLPEYYHFLIGLCEAIPKDTLENLTIPASLDIVRMVIIHSLTGDWYIVQWGRDIHQQIYWKL